MTSVEVAIRFFERHLKEDILKYGERQAIHMAISALRAQDDHFREATKKVDHKWISVEERLPEDWLWVQVYSSANGTMDTDFRTPSKRGGWHHYDNITHWMPLPEPPEVEV